LESREEAGVTQWLRLFDCGSAAGELSPSGSRPDHSSANDPDGEWRKRNLKKSRHIPLVLPALLFIFVPARSPGAGYTVLSIAPAASVVLVGRA